MILIFGALLAVYVFCRAILPLRLKWGWKALLAVLLAVAAFKFHLLHLFGGPMFFSPVLPEGVLLAAAWLFSVLFLFFFLHPVYLLIHLLQIDRLHLMIRVYLTPFRWTHLVRWLRVIFFLTDHLIGFSHLLIIGISLAQHCHPFNSIKYVNAN